MCNWKQSLRNLQARLFFSLGKATQTKTFSDFQVVKCSYYFETFLKPILKATAKSSPAYLYTQAQGGISKNRLNGIDAVFKNFDPSLEWVVFDC